MGYPDRIHRADRDAAAATIAGVRVERRLSGPAPLEGKSNGTFLTGLAAGAAHYTAHGETPRRDLSPVGPGTPICRVTLQGPWGAGVQTVPAKRAPSHPEIHDGKAFWICTQDPFRASADAVATAVAPIDEARFGHRPWRAQLTSLTAKVAA